MRPKRTAARLATERLQQDHQQSAGDDSDEEMTTTEFRDQKYHEEEEEKDYFAEQPPQKRQRVKAPQKHDRAGTAKPTPTRPPNYWSRFMEDSSASQTSLEHIPLDILQEAIFSRISLADKLNLSLVSRCHRALVLFALVSVQEEEFSDLFTTFGQEDDMQEATDPSALPHYYHEVGQYRGSNRYLAGKLHAIAALSHCQRLRSLAIPEHYSRWASTRTQEGTTTGAFLRSLKTGGFAGLTELFLKDAVEDLEALTTELRTNGCMLEKLHVAPKEAKLSVTDAKAIGHLKTLSALSVASVGNLTPFQEISKALQGHQGLKSLQITQSAFIRGEKKTRKSTTSFLGTKSVEVIGNTLTRLRVEAWDMSSKSITTALSNMPHLLYFSLHLGKCWWEYDSSKTRDLLPTICAALSPTRRTDQAAKNLQELDLNVIYGDLSMSSNEATSLSTIRSLTLNGGAGEVFVEPLKSLRELWVKGPSLAAATESPIPVATLHLSVDGKKKTSKEFQRTAEVISLFTLLEDASLELQHGGVAESWSVFLENLPTNVRRLSCEGTVCLPREFAFSEHLEYLRICTPFKEPKQGDANGNHFSRISLPGVKHLRLNKQAYYPSDEHNPLVVPEMLQFLHAISEHSLATVLIQARPQPKFQRPPATPADSLALEIKKKNLVQSLQALLLGDNVSLEIEVDKDEDIDGFADKFGAAGLANARAVHRHTEAKDNKPARASLGLVRPLTDIEREDAWIRIAEKSAEQEQQGDVSPLELMTLPDDVIRTLVVRPLLRVLEQGPRRERVKTLLALSATNVRMRHLILQDDSLWKDALLPVNDGSLHSVVSWRSDEASGDKGRCEELHRRRAWTGNTVASATLREFVHTRGREAEDVAHCTKCRKHICENCKGGSRIRDGEREYTCKRCNVFNFCTGCELVSSFGHLFQKPIDVTPENKCAGCRFPLCGATRTEEALTIRRASWAEETGWTEQFISKKFSQIPQPCNSKCRVCQKMLCVFCYSSKKRKGICSKCTKLPLSEQQEKTKAAKELAAAETAAVAATTTGEAASAAPAGDPQERDEDSHVSPDPNNQRSSLMTAAQEHPSECSLS